MTEANRLTHYMLFVAAFLWVNAIQSFDGAKIYKLFVAAFLWVNAIIPSCTRLTT